ncbi:hypothetical protein [Alkalimarinus sediminis]|uniref:Uncharacterized protein n=1 Tax=Alkalimarinus sediminis TaxID=1632866 RepID=A0A9E8HIY3_9ALTE|nr:hypothetical protein [Alkalimarinus sediminis]UZW75234.1 hypothetical protein NNL22_01095 [Alkalimarinus sediminis]
MKKLFARSLMASAIALAAVGCGSSSSGGGAAATGETISGTASAPGGSVAAFEHKNAFEIALSYVVTPVAAAITGLEPVPGATVELIRVDDTGTQIGDVIATTATSITGDYTLTLPAGVNLAGNLIVRITGANGTEMRAQVVEKEVDITPVSEFVLSKFIDQGADLDNLTTASVVKLSGQVEEFDLTAGVDMSTMLAALEKEAGVFVENQIDLIESTPADASLIASLAGDYRSSALDFGLHDDDQQYGTGTFSVDVYQSNFTFADGGNGLVSITINGEEADWANLSGSDLNNGNINLYYVAESDSEVETFTSPITSTGVIAIESTFEEDVDGDYGWRTYPSLFSLQKVKDKNIFVLLGGEAEVRYATIDTNGDNIKDAVDPSQKEGDEVFKSFEVFLKKPAAMDPANLDGTFGRVYLGAFLNSNGSIELESELNTLSFDGAAKDVDISAASRKAVNRNSSGTVNYASDQTQAEPGLPVVTAPDGDIVSIKGAATDGFINDSYDFITFADAGGTNGSDANFSKTLAIKLPSTAPVVSGKNYRLMFLGVGFDGTELLLSSTQFNTILAMSSNTAGTLTGKSSTVYKPSLSGEVTPESGESINLSATVNIAQDGATTITLPEGNKTFLLEGFINGEGSLGIFRTSYGANGSAEELGLAALIEVTE